MYPFVSIMANAQELAHANPISKSFTNGVGNGQCENGLTPTLQTIMHTNLQWTQICHIPHANANTDSHIEYSSFSTVYLYVVSIIKTLNKHLKFVSL